MPWKGLAHRRERESYGRDEEVSRINFTAPLKTDTEVATHLGWFPLARLASFLHIKFAALPLMSAMGH
jgi:hypothetical protein